MKIRDFQERLRQIYGPVNDQRSWDYDFGYLSRTVGYLGKAAKRNAAGTIDFFRPISWLSAVASRLGVDLHDAFFKRYPGICPYCLELTCVCRRTRKQPREEMPPYKITERLRTHYETLVNVEKSPNQLTPIFSFQHATEIIRTVYPANEIVWFHAGPAYHFGKLHEEVAEIHEAASNYEKGKRTRIAPLAEEIGDVLAWLVSAWDIVFRSKSLGEELTGYYLKGCPVCGNQVCACGNRGERADGLIGAEALTTLLEITKRLEQIFPGGGLDELARSLEVAIATQNQPTARASLVQIQTKLKTLTEIPVPKARAEEAKSLLDRLLNALKDAVPFNELDGM